MVIRAALRIARLEVMRELPKTSARVPSQGGSQPRGSQDRGRDSLDVELRGPERLAEARLLGDLFEAARSTPGRLDENRIDAILGVGE